MLLENKRLKLANRWSDGRARKVFGHCRDASRRPVRLDCYSYYYWPDEARMEASRRTCSLLDVSSGGSGGGGGSGGAT